VLYEYSSFFFSLRKGGQAKKKEEKESRNLTLRKEVGYEIF